VEIWNKDKEVLDMRFLATQEARSGQPAGTIPFISRDLISLSKLDTAGYSFKFEMDVAVCLNIIILLVLVFFVIVYTN